MNAKRAGGESEDVGPVRLHVARYRLEMDPAENQRKRDREREDAAPHDQRVRQSADAVALEDEAVQREVGGHAYEPVANVAREVLAAEKELPSAVPVTARRRPLKPHRIAVGDAERREQHGERVADQ